MRFWRNWQFVVIGLANGIGKGPDGVDVESERELRSPPQEYLTFLGLVALLIFLGLVIAEFCAHVISSVILNQKLDYITNDTLMEDLAENRTASDWFNKYGFKKCSPTFEEEYLYYKCYKWMAKREYRKSERTYLPNNIDEVATEAKKNYLTYKLAGIKERPL